MKKLKRDNIEIAVSDHIGMKNFKEIKKRINDGRITSHLELRLWGLSDVYAHPSYLKVIYKALKAKKTSWFIF
tara:strand:+ start:582 stop:800 length:219 start_codon:yes stop_codon:yes gene_type:complete